MSLCSKNRLGKSGSPSKVNDGRGSRLKNMKILKNTNTIAAFFPRGVQNEEIQQWRQARSRPGEKEIHNIKLREKISLCSKNRLGENGYLFKVNGGRGSHENYSRRFPEGVHKEEIQQWRQARSRPGEKETLNIMSREKLSKIDHWEWINTEWDNE